MAALPLYQMQKGQRAMANQLYPLTPDQQEAVEPQETIWLSASAGTGKTQVLTARVFRLLMQPGVKPENILCLTYTKAGAAEMAERISGDLARWVQADDTVLGRDLHAIGAPAGPEACAKARTLFASVLDAPGGGLAIQTIHSFCQSLLANFPIEAGITPGFTALDDQDKTQLIDETLNQILQGGTQSSEADTPAMLETVRSLSLLQDQETVTSFLLRCGAKPDIWEKLPHDLRPAIFLALGLEPDDDAENLTRYLTNRYIDRDNVEAIKLANLSWNAKTGKDNSELLSTWLSADAPARAEIFDNVLKVFLKTDGDFRVTSKKLIEAEPNYDQIAAELVEQLWVYQDKKKALAYAEMYIPALEAGRAFGKALNAAKAREGKLDFDDIIRNTSALLNRKAMAEWVRYKLDRRIDHILVDESQDTNALQWAIVLALTSDFFTGEGAQSNKQRTLFTVGDFKQAIFSFQGTSPFNYEAARGHFTRKLEESDGIMQKPVLAKSFRTAQPVLDFVDMLLESLGHDALELPEPAAPHIGLPQPGSVMLWQPIGQGDDADDAAHQDGEDGQAEGWFSKPERMLADNIAQQIRRWLDEGLYLEKKERLANAGDVMILVKKRGDLARLIVNRLYAHNVRVAGMDRLRIGQPLAVRDLCAAARFTLQPEDDLNLACLLVSPLLGWSHGQLHELGYRPKGIPLWRHLRDKLPRDDARIAPLFDILAMADYDTPYDFFESILSGKLEGRAKLTARLGNECLDPIEEFLGISQSYQQNHHPVMQSFLHWFDAIDSELTRDVVSNDEVRVMTVHGAKGLQAPIVIMADSHINPKGAKQQSVDLPIEIDGIGYELPLWPAAKDLLAGPVLEANNLAKERALAEHWRLAYVAMTRAEEHLCLAGIQPARGPAMPDDSWYKKANDVMISQELEPHSDMIWGGCQLYGQTPVFKADGIAEKVAVDSAISSDDDKPELPLWALQNAPQEARPPRPLAPSSLGDDDWASPPSLGDKAQMAALRGTLLHQLFERLPDVSLDNRASAARGWLERRATLLSAAMIDEIVQTAIDVIDNPEWRDVFGPDAMAEVNFAATVNGIVINGTIDRLIVSGNIVRAIDFKTGRNPPEQSGDISRAYMRQMAAYGAALAQTYPDHKIELGLLFTHNARLFWLDDERLKAAGQGWLFG